MARAAEGNHRRQFFAPEGDLDVPSGFAKNGDALVSILQRHYLWYIEIMFDVLKNLLHAFCFRFWTKRLPRHPRRPRANRDLHAPAAAQLSTVEACWQAYETFVLGAVIAHGLLQLIALRFGALVWQHHHLYLRTQSRALPSEKTVKQVLAPRLLQQFVHLPAISILQKIQRCFDADPDDDDEKNRWAA
jgi:hypothetical protein